MPYEGQTFDLMLNMSSHYVWRSDERLSDIFFFCALLALIVHELRRDLSAIIHLSQIIVTYRNYVVSTFDDLWWWRDVIFDLTRAPTGVWARVWNGLDWSIGSVVQSSSDGFGLDWISDFDLHWIMDWTGLQNWLVLYTYLISICSLNSASRWFSRQCKTYLVDATTLILPIVLT